MNIPELNWDEHSDEPSYWFRHNGHLIQIYYSQPLDACWGRIDGKTISLPKPATRTPEAFAEYAINWLKKR
jgi:hypothetical protein